MGTNPELIAGVNISNKIYPYGQAESWSIVGVARVKTTPPKITF